MVRGYGAAQTLQRNIIGLVERADPRTRGRYPTKTRSEVLLTDDSNALRTICAEALTARGWEVLEAASGREAFAKMEGHDPPVAVIDLVLPDMGGLSILTALRERNPDCKVILMTGFASLDSAVEAVRRGAYDYLRKPFAATDLIQIVDKAYTAYLEARRAGALQQEAAPGNDAKLGALAGLSAELQRATSNEEALRLILHKAVELTEADSGAVLLLDEGLPVARVAVAEGGLAGGLARAELPRDAGLIAQCLAADGPVSCHDMGGRHPVQDETLDALGTYSAMACPISVNGQAVGVLAVFDKFHAPFSHQDKALATVLAMHAATPASAFPTAEPTANEPPEQSRDSFVSLREAFGG